jgi:urease accessory protein
MITGKLLHIIQLADPSLPIGGFSHSAGLETYTNEGIVHNKKTAEVFIRQQLAINLHYTDSALVSLIYDAASRWDTTEISTLDTLCTAIKLPMEIRQASQMLGNRLLKIFENQSGLPLSLWYLEKIKNSILDGHYCLAFGLLGFELNADKQETLTAFYYSNVAGLVTNAVKLVPLGQKDGRELLMSFFPLINELVVANQNPDKEKIGFCCAGLDIRSMQHEQLYSRMYMS